MPDKAAVQVGEAMKINMEVCTRISISNLEMVEFPNCDKLSTIILDAAISEEAYEESIGEKQFSCKALLANEYYPMEPGNLQLSHFSCRIKLNEKSYDFKSKELDINVLENNKAGSGYLPSDIDKIVCRLLDDSRIKEGIVRYEVEITGKGCPGLFKLDSMSFDKSAEFSVELADTDVSKNFKTKQNKRCLIYTLRLKEAGNYSFRPSCRYWDSQNHMIREISDSVQLINLVQKPLNNDIEKSVKSENDIYFLVDLSSSMMFQDYSPNRFSYVKNIMKKALLNKNPSDRVAIIGFTSETALFSPLTENTKLLNAAIDSLEVGKMTDGTSLGKPVYRALLGLYASNAKQKTVVIFSDFVDNSASIYKKSWLSQVAGQMNVSIVSVIVGTNGKGRGPIARRPDGSYVYGTINLEMDEKSAENITEYTKGKVIKTANGIQVNLKDLLTISVSRPNNIAPIKNYLLESLFGF
jgi:Ca-activated chloride channel family protein